jgi:hypothetical protein
MAVTEAATFLFTDLVGSTAMSSALELLRCAHTTAEGHGHAQLGRRAGALLAQATRP